jgi:hypothetical protein
MHSMMNHQRWNRWAAVLLSLSLVTAHAETTPTAEASEDSSRNSTTVTYTELTPLVVRARRPSSPKAAAMKLRVVSGRTADRLDRGPLRESPKFAAMRIRRDTGITPDRLDREVPELSPKAEASLASAALAP